MTGLMAWETAHRGWAGSKEGRVTRDQAWTDPRLGRIASRVRLALGPVAAVYIQFSQDRLVGCMDGPAPG